MSVQKTLGQKIREERKLNKMTQKELSGNFITRNMLSQIENDQAKPSITTMAYLAKRLNKSIDYFMNEHTKTEQMSKLARELMTDYKDDHCSEVLERLETIKEQSPSIYHSEFIRDLYINCHFKKGDKAMKEKNYEEALDFYTKLLEFESDFLLDKELTAYELYTKLVDAYTLIEDSDMATHYNIKAKDLIRKLMANKEVQNLYLLFTQNDNKEAIKSAQKVEYDLLDDYNKARYDMVVGSAYCNMNMYTLSIEFLERSLSYYKGQKNNSITSMIYEELARCYMNLDEHEKAKEYKLKAIKNQTV